MSVAVSVEQRIGVSVRNMNNYNTDTDSRNVEEQWSSAVDERGEEKRSRSRRTTRTTRAMARSLVKAVFRIPACCRPSSASDRDEFAVTEWSSDSKHSHIPYVPRKAPHPWVVLVPQGARELRSQHLPHVQCDDAPRRRLRPQLQTQRKVIIYPPNSGSTTQPTSTRGQWRIGFDNSNRWDSPLQGWSLTGDAFSGVGDPSLCFDCRGDAISYVQKYGWSFKVEGELENHKRNKSVGAYGWVELMRPPEGA